MSKLIYEGSVKNLWEVDTRTLEFEYTDAYSVFDWGRMPDHLNRKGESLASLGTFFFDKMSDALTWKNVSAQLESLTQQDKRWALVQGPLHRELHQLASTGMKHHFEKRVGPNRLRVRRYPSNSPKVRSGYGQTFYDYTDAHSSIEQDRFIPLEVIFRFGIPKGSSLVQRLTSQYAQQLGFSDVPREGAQFSAPVVEFFSKLEGTDRFLTYEQALHYSGLRFVQWERILLYTIALALWLRETFERAGLELWDGKFEWALSGGEPVLVDSVGPDELRLLDPKTGTQISKEFLRGFYRKTPWYAEMQQIKRQTESEGGAVWKQKVLDRVGPPPRLSGLYRAVADRLYPSLALAVTGENPGGGGMPLEEILGQIRECEKAG